MFADLFTDVGRRSVPPRSVAVVMVLQRIEGLSDREAVERFAFDVTGRARVLYTTAEEEEAERAQLLPWTATLKRRYVRVLPSEITGRRFRFGSEPDHDGPFA